MEGRRIEAHVSGMLVLILFATGLVKLGVAEVHVTPQFASIQGSPDDFDFSKCWSSLFNVQGCVLEFYKSGVTGKIENVGPTCCKAYKEVDAECWPKTFPLNPLFSPLLKKGCAARTKLPIIPGAGVEPAKCWSSLVSVPGCATEIYKSFFTEKIGNVGVTCCKAILSTVHEKCWSQMFPLNPFFPPFFKDGCAGIIVHYMFPGPV